MEPSKAPDPLVGTRDPLPPNDARAAILRAVATRVTSSRFIGRTGELAELLGPLSGDASDLPAFAFIAGESGVGKSRLLAELTEAASARDLRVIGGACIELGDDELPFAPLIGALRPLVRGGDQALARMSASGRAELARLVPELGQAPADSDGDRGDSQRLFDAVLELIAVLGEESPQGVLLWIEDIHWADSSTRSLLALPRRECPRRAADDRFHLPLG